MNRFEELIDHHDFLSEDLSVVRGLIRESVTSGLSGIDQALERFTRSSGKMLRPAMVMLAARFGPDFDRERMQRLAAAIEILHIATLVHDDIVDSSPLRRGVPTLHTTEGSRKAVLLGDYLFTRCFRLVSDIGAPESSGFLAGAVGLICESELTRSMNVELSRRSYVRWVTGKTAMLFILALATGARESGADDDIVMTFRAIGYGLGLSFQITDDLLDFDGRPDKTGKPVNKDDGLATLPLILTAQSGDAAVSRLCGKRQRRFPPVSARRLREAVVAADGIGMARREAALYTENVRRLVGSLPGIPAREALIGIADAIVFRDR